MASLRTLLDIVSESSIAAAAQPNTTTKLPPFPSTGYRVQYIPAFCGATCQGWTTDYNYYDYPSWTVPTGVTDVIFEIWGAGGGGGSSCCCSRGVPGGSGAYAYKRVQGSSIAGCTYAMEIGQPGQGRDGNACGQPGGKTFITGYGLSNYCATGGHGGCSCCFM